MNVKIINHVLLLHAINNTGPMNYEYYGNGSGISNLLNGGVSLMNDSYEFNLRIQIKGMYAL